MAEDISAKLQALLLLRIEQSKDDPTLQAILKDLLEIDRELQSMVEAGRKKFKLPDSPISGGAKGDSKTWEKCQF